MRSPSSVSPDLRRQRLEAVVLRVLAPQFGNVLIVVAADILVSHHHSAAKALVDKLQHRDLPKQLFAQLAFC